MAMTVAGETYQVAVVKTNECASIWLQVTTEMGVVVPRVDKPDAEEK